MISWMSDIVIFCCDMFCTHNTHPALFYFLQPLQISESTKHYICHMLSMAQAWYIWHITATQQVRCNSCTFNVLSNTLNLFIFEMISCDAASGT